MEIDIYIQKGNERSEVLSYWRNRHDIVGAIKAMYPAFNNNNNNNDAAVPLLLGDVIVLQNALTLSVVTKVHPCPEDYFNDMAEIGDVIYHMVGEDRKRVFFSVCY